MRLPKFLTRKDPNHIPPNREMVQPSLSVKPNESKSPITRKAFEDTGGSLQIRDGRATESFRYGGPEKKGMRHFFAAKAGKASSIVKTFAASAAGSAVIFGGAKFAFNSSVRAVDTFGVGTAAFMGGAAALQAYLKDRREAGEDETWRVTLRKNGKKYFVRFGAGAAGGFAGAYGIDALMETDFGAALLERAAPVRSWMGDKWSAIKGGFSSLKDTLTGAGDAAPSGGVTGAIERPEAAPAESATNETAQPEEVSEPQEAAPEQPVAEELPVEVEAEIPLSALDQLAALQGLNEQAQDIASRALAGDLQALKDAADGSFNGRFGFEQSRELGAALMKQAADAGHIDAKVNLAYILYRPEFADLGVGHDPEGALRTIREIGRSWVGGEELLADMITGDGSAAMHCTEVSGSGFSCENTGAPLVPGNTIDVTAADGSPHRMRITEKMNSMSRDEYVGRVLGSLREAIPAPVP